MEEKKYQEEVERLINIIALLEDNMRTGMQLTEAQKLTLSEATELLADLEKKSKDEVADAIKRAKEEGDADLFEKE